jgi:hypothetical protein
VSCANSIVRAQLTGRSATYIVFIVIMCLGLPIALCLSPAEKGESGLDHSFKVAPS